MEREKRVRELTERGEEGASKWEFQGHCAEGVDG